MKFHLFLFILCCSFSLSSQELQLSTIPIKVNGKEVKYPYAGGLNCPQFNEVDLNLDGVLDLMVFDREGFSVTPFVFDKVKKEYIYSPEYISHFPKLTYWVCMRDYNKDGIRDIFASSYLQGPSGIEVYKGEIKNGKLTYTLVPFQHNGNFLQFPIGNAYSQIPVDYTDFPAIDDVDFDGDLDILTFAPGGTRVDMYTNVAVERNWSLDSLQFLWTDPCYGNFIESGLTSDITLSGSNDSCAGFKATQIRHSGSTLLSVNLDNNPLKDLLIGDLSNNHLVALYNTGTKNDAYMSSKDIQWNKDDVRVNVTVFNGAYASDINHDGKEDVLVAPTFNGASENVNQVYYYENTGTVDNPYYEYKRRNFLVGDMIDFGAGAAPCFVDYNQDGKMDLIVGTEGIYYTANSRFASLVLFENVGTNNAPLFQLIDSNYLNMAQYSLAPRGTTSFTPTFGDLDNDGDLDIVVGDYLGSLFYAENIAGAGKPFKFNDFVYEYQDINVGNNSTPSLVDLNRDGLLDLLIGSRLGNNDKNNLACSAYYYFQNIGIKNSPVFDPDPEKLPNTVCVGNALIKALTSKVYSSASIVDLKGKYYMFSGGELGKTTVYTDLENNIYAAFNKISEDYGNLAIGSKTRLSVADIDDDGILDMAVGNQKGGIAIYKTDYRTDGTRVSSTNPTISKMLIYPNPVTDKLFFSSSTNEIKIIRIFDISGHNLYATKTQDVDITIDVSNLSQGIYFIECMSNGKLGIQHFIKN